MNKKRNCLNKELESIWIYTESINNKLVMKFYKYYNLIKTLNLVAEIPNIDANDKTYDEEEINGLTVYYDSLPSKILTKEEVTAL